MPDHHLRPAVKFRSAPLLASTFCFAQIAVAQLPVDTALIVEDTPIVAEYYQTADVLGRGVARVRSQSVFLDVTNLTCDAVDPQIFYYQSAATSFAGTWQGTMEAMASIGPNVWGPWSRLGASALACNDTAVFTLSGTDIQSVPRAGGTATTLFTVPGAVDIAARPGFVYAVVFASSSLQPIIEWDVQAATQRTVGTLAGMTCVAVSPVSNELIIGTNAGDLVRVDIATGNTVSIFPTGIGAIEHVEATRFGTAVYCNATELWSELAPGGPIFTSASAIRDFGIVTSEGASVGPFGSGCGPLGSVALMTTNGNPALGNTAWQLGIEQAPANSLALLALGLSRTTSIFGPLPLSLQLFGAPVDCLLLASTDALFVAQTSATGEGNVSIPIPNLPALTGTELAAQWSLPSPNNAAGFEVTEAAAIVVR